MAFKMAGFSGFKENKDYTPPSPEQQIKMAQEASEKAGKKLRYDRALSEQAGDHRFS